MLTDASPRGSIVVSAGRRSSCSSISARAWRLRDLRDVLAAKLVHQRLPRDSAHNHRPARRQFSRAPASAQGFIAGWLGSRVFRSVGYCCYRLTALRRPFPMVDFPFAAAALLSGVSVIGMDHRPSSSRISCPELSRRFKACSVRSGR